MSPDQVDARRRAEMTHAAPANGASAAVSRMADVLDRLGTVPEDVRFSNPLSLLSYIPGLGRPGSMLPGAAYGIPAAVYGIPAAVVNAPGNLKKMFMGAMGEIGQRLEGRVQPGTPLGEDMLGLLMSMPGAGMLMGPKGAVGMSGGRLASAAERLPMDEASRMARAAEQGFTTDAYHGTTELAGIAEKGQFAPNGRGVHWFAGSPKTANTYAGDLDATYLTPVSPGMVAAKLRASDPLVVDAGGASFSYIPVDRLLAAIPDGVRRDNLLQMLDNPRSTSTDGIAALARRLGYDGVVVKNVRDEKFSGDAPGTVHAVFDPKNIRSRFAAFDPAKRDSADLLAAGGVGPVGPMMLQAAPPKSEPLAHPRGGWY